jgi:hypothetical protein
MPFDGWKTADKLRWLLLRQEALVGGVATLLLAGDDRSDLPLLLTMFHFGELVAGTPTGDRSRKFRHGRAGPIFERPRERTDNLRSRETGYAAVWVANSVSVCHDVTLLGGFS